MLKDLYINRCVCLSDLGLNTFNMKIQLLVIQLSDPFSTVRRQFYQFVNS